MRLFLAILLVTSGLSGASSAEQEDRVTFRLYLGDIFKIYGQASLDDRGTLASYCEVFAKDEAKRRGGGEVWQGMVSECFGYAELSDDGHWRAACEYFIEAAAHYRKAVPEAYEADALEASRAEMTRQIEGLGC